MSLFTSLMASAGGAILPGAIENSAGKAALPGAIADAVDAPSGLLGRAAGTLWNNKGKLAAGGLTGAAGMSIYNSPSIPNQRQGDSGAITGMSYRGADLMDPNNSGIANGLLPQGKDKAQALQYNAPALMAPEMMKSFTKGMQDNTPRATALPTQSVAQRQQYMDADRPANTGMDAFNEALNAAGNAAHGNGFAGVLGAGVAMKLGAMKASAGMADQSRYQKWVSAINENVARRNTEAMSQAQQNNAMALDRAQLMQGSERLRVGAIDARNTLGADLVGKATYMDQIAATAANNQFNADRAVRNDNDSRDTAIAKQIRNDTWAGRALRTSAADMPQLGLAINASNGKTITPPSEGLFNAGVARQQEDADNASVRNPYSQYGQYGQ